MNDLDLSRFALGGFTGSTTETAENSLDFGRKRNETFFFTPAPGLDTWGSGPGHVVDTRLDV